MSWTGGRLLSLPCIFLPRLLPLPLDLEELTIQEVDGANEVAEVIAGDGVISGVGADCEVCDRHLAAHGAIEAIVAEGIKGPEIEPMPLPGLVFASLALGWAKPVFVGVFFGQFSEPTGVAGRPFARQARAEGG